jgi:hypothetical protein
VEERAAEVGGTGAETSIGSSTYRNQIGMVTPRHRDSRSKVVSTNIRVNIRAAAITSSTLDRSIHMEAQEITTRVTAGVVAEVIITRGTTTTTGIRKSLAMLSPRNQRLNLRL